MNIIGFIFFTIMDTGEKNKPLIFNSIIINYMNNKYHIHHWIIFLILFLIVILILIRNKFIHKYINIAKLFLGVCLGSILQGLMYNDAFEIKLN